MRPIGCLHGAREDHCLHARPRVHPMHICGRAEGQGERLNELGILASWPVKAGPPSSWEGQGRCTAIFRDLMHV